MSQTVKDLTAGTAGGIAQVLVGQPFDIVKVRMQTSAKGTYRGMLHCAGGILTNEGPFAFYKVELAEFSQPYHPLTIPTTRAP